MSVSNTIHKITTGVDKTTAFTDQDSDFGTKEQFLATEQFTKEQFWPPAIYTEYKREI